MQRRGPSDWTDLIGELMPIIITVLIGLLALTKRLVDGVFRRRAAEAAAKPKPPLNEEVRQFLEEMERDRRGLFGGRREEESQAEEAAEEAGRREDPPPALRESRAEPAPLEALAPSAPALVVAPMRPTSSVRFAISPASAVTRRRSAVRPDGAGTFDLKRAFAWAEILAAPVALREGAGFAPGGEPMPPPPASRG